MASYDNRAHIEWAKRTKKKGRVCQTCELYPEVCKVVADVVELIRTGESQVSLNKLLEYVQAKPYNYKFKISALRKHVRGCLGGTNVRSA